MIASRDSLRDFPFARPIRTFSRERVPAGVGLAPPKPG
jgi:hypothetical protein